MSEELESFLTLLKDESEEIDPHLLSVVSDLDRHDLKRFMSVWKALSELRRRDLIQLLGREADEHIELFFEAINRLALEDPDAEVRRLAIDNLWECEDSRLVPSLLNALENDDDENVRAAAAKALGRFVLMGQMDKISQTNLTRIEQSLLQSHANDPSRYVNLAALEAIGYSSRENVSSIISQAYEKDDAASKQSALKAMGRSANNAWAAQIISSLYDKTPEVRGESAIAAGELELKDAVDPLIELLDDPHPLVIEAAVWGLGHAGGKKAEESLIAFSEANEDPQLEEPIQEALEYIAFINGLTDFSILDFDDPSEALPID
jgi:HEAT repeat protein